MSSAPTTPRTALPDRIRSAEVARMLGFSLRTIQVMTAAGEIPGALRRKRVWTYDPLQAEALIKALEAKAWRESQRAKEPCRYVPTRRTAFSTMPDCTIDAAYERAVGPKRAATRSGDRKQRNR